MEAYMEVEDDYHLILQENT